MNHTFVLPSRPGSDGLRKGGSGSNNGEEEAAAAPARRARALVAASRCIWKCMSAHETVGKASASKSMADLCV